VKGPWAKAGPPRLLAVPSRGHPLPPRFWGKKSGNCKAWAPAAPAAPPCPILPEGFPPFRPSLQSLWFPESPPNALMPRPGPPGFVPALGPSEARVGEARLPPPPLWPKSYRGQGGQKIGLWFAESGKSCRRWGTWGLLWAVDPTQSLPAPYPGPFSKPRRPGLPRGAEILTNAKGFQMSSPDGCLPRRQVFPPERPARQSNVAPPHLNRPTFLFPPPGANPPWELAQAAPFPLGLRDVPLQMKKKPTPVSWSGSPFLERQAVGPENPKFLHPGSAPSYLEKSGPPGQWERASAPRP